MCRPLPPCSAHGVGVEDGFSQDSGLLLNPAVIPSQPTQRGSQVEPGQAGQGGPPWPTLPLRLSKLYFPV